MTGAIILNRAAERLHIIEGHPFGQFIVGKGGGQFLDRPPQCQSEAEEEPPLGIQSEFFFRSVKLTGLTSLTCWIARWIETSVA